MKQNRELIHCFSWAGSCSAFSRALPCVTFICEDKYHHSEHPLLPSFPQTVYADHDAVHLGYPMGQLGPAASALSPLKGVCTPSPLAGEVV